MRIGLDTSVLLRLLTGEPADLATAALRRVESALRVEKGRPRGWSEVLWRGSGKLRALRSPAARAVDDETVRIALVGRWTTRCAAWC